MGFSTPKKPFDLKEFMENSIKKRPPAQRGYNAKRLAERKRKEPDPPNDVEVEKAPESDFPGAQGQ